MTFQPIVPLTGYAGWRFLERTADAQLEVYKDSAPVTRATDYFRENIGGVSTAEDLVADRRLLEVALGAYGLQDDIDNKYFLQKVLEDGTLNPDSLANRLSDTRYLEFSKAFGFGDFPVPNTVLSTFADDVVQRYESESFEVAIGQIDDNMRLALNLKSSLSDIINGSSSVDAQWFSIMGNAPLRSVFESALGLPSSIGTIDIDQQLTAFKEASNKTLGSEDPSDLATDETKEKIIRLFMLRSEVQSASAFSGSTVALTLLSQIA